MRTLGDGKPSSLTLIAGEALLFSAMQFSLGSVELSSKFSVRNFTKDQETMNNAVRALKDYNVVALVWTIGVALMFGGIHGWTGLIASVVFNFAFVLWINLTYFAAFHEAAQKFNLTVPSMFSV